MPALTELTHHLLQMIIFGVTAKTHVDKNLGYTFSSHPLSFSKWTFIGQFFIRRGTFGFCFSFRVHMFHLGVRIRLAREWNMREGHRRSHCWKICWFVIPLKSSPSSSPLMGDLPLAGSLLGILLYLSPLLSTVWWRDPGFPLPPSLQRRMRDLIPQWVGVGVGVP